MTVLKNDFVELVIFCRRRITWIYYFTCIVNFIKGGHTLVGSGKLLANREGELNKKQQCLAKKRKKTIMSFILFPILFAFTFLSSPVLSASDLVLAKVDRRVSLLTSFLFSSRFRVSISHLLLFLFSSQHITIHRARLNYTLPRISSDLHFLYIARLYSIQCRPYNQKEWIGRIHDIWITSLARFYVFCAVF